MAGLSITIEINGLGANKARLDKLKTGLETDMLPAMEEIGDLGAKYFAGKAFQSRGIEFGEEWPELNPQYAEWKQRNYPGRPIMVRGGDESERLNESFTYEVTPFSARIYNTASYFKYHQSSAARKRIPRRIMLGVTPTLHTIAREAVEKRVRELIGGL